MSHRESVSNESLRVRYSRVTTSHTKRRDVRPHSRNQNIPSSPSMNLDPSPPVRPLLTHVIADEPLRCEAGIITLLLDERPTLAFELLATTDESPGTPLRIVLLEVGVEALAACQSKTGVGSCESVVGECYDLDFSGLLTLNSHALFMWVTHVR